MSEFGFGNVFKKAQFISLTFKLVKWELFSDFRDVIKNKTCNIIRN